MTMDRHTAIAISIASIFLGLGVGAAAGASDSVIGTIAILGFFIALGLVVRLEG
jgi:hypothetical protein